MASEAVTAKLNLKKYIMLTNNTTNVYNNIYVTNKILRPSPTRQ